MEIFRRNNVDKGYSLIEVLVGIWLFSVVFVLIAGIFLNNYVVSSYAPHIVKATNIAHNALLDLKDIDYELVRSRILPHPIGYTGPSTPHAYTVMVDAVEYTITESVTRRTGVSTDEDYDILDLEVTAEWLDVTVLDITNQRAHVEKSEAAHVVRLRSSISPVGKY